jgi:hypothetical protein
VYDSASQLGHYYTGRDLPQNGGGLLLKAAAAQIEMYQIRMCYKVDPHSNRNEFRRVFD